MPFWKCLARLMFCVAFVSQAHAASVDCAKTPKPVAQRIGPYSFKAFCRIKGTGVNMHSVSHPMIVAPANAATTKWNALAAKTATTAFPHWGPGDFDSFDIAYTIGYASDRLISVHFELYANSAGSAYPTIAETDLNVKMPHATPLRVGDLFKVTPQWKAFMAAQLGAAFEKMAGMSPSAGGVSKNKLDSQSTDPAYWFIDAKDLTIETGDLVSVPNSDIKAAISWSALKPYLVANPPVH